MCTLNFSEHVGHNFAAKYPYVFKDEFASDTKGLNEYERNVLQVALRKYVEFKLNHTDPQEWRRQNQNGLIRKFMQKRINFQMLGNMFEEQQF